MLIECMNECINLCFRNSKSDKTVKDKIKNVKGVKGLKILLKEVASSSSSDKCDRKLIGSALIPLKVWLGYWCAIKSLQFLCCVVPYLVVC